MIRFPVFLRGVTTIACIIMVVLGFFIVRDWKSLQHRSFGTFRRRPPVRMTVESIQPWMTFEYLNRVFHLQPNYLQTELHITDTRYPRLSIHAYAKELSPNAESALIQVKNAIWSYRE